jgi:carbamoyltransferase
MILLGCSGFETAGGQSRLPWQPPQGDLEHLFEFSERRVPLQYFPLHLIGHDSSAVLLKDGQILSFIAEERLTRLKHGFNLAGHTTLPRRAMACCLREANVAWHAVDYFVHYCHFTEESVRERAAAVGHNLRPKERALLVREYSDAYASRLKRSVILRQLSEIAGCEIPDAKLIQVPHHLAHAAGAFYSSGSPESLILTLDGYGEKESSLWAIGAGREICSLGSMALPTSLGMLYQVITAFLGFRAFGDEYKVMGLAAYGKPNVWKRAFQRLVEPLSDGTYFVEAITRPNLLPFLRETFGDLGSDYDYRRKADVAAALQTTLEETVLHLLTELRKRNSIKRVCLSGGVALNSCLNSRILRSRLFDEVFIQPAASDDGTSLGAALYAHHNLLGGPRTKPIRHVFWGSCYEDAQIEAALHRTGDVRWKKSRNVESETARLLADGKTVGWFQGRSEMGPRALGSRSILADPRSASVRVRLNRIIKNREAFRPFAPAVANEHARDYFDVPAGTAAPFMLITFPAHPERINSIPAVVHVDGTARIQTVTAQDNPRFYRLLQRFCALTQVPVLLNTSFNRAGEPMVNSPDDALRCLLSSGLDALVIEEYVVYPLNGHAARRV